MLDLVGLLAVASAFFIISASPGPATLALASMSMSSGRYSGLRFALGLSIGLGVWGIVAATGLGAVLKASTQILMLLKLVGGLYLLYLAWTSGRSAVKNTHVKNNSIQSNRSFRLGLFLNLSNPQAVFAWMATLTLGINNTNSPWQVIVSTAVCIFLGLLIYTFYALVFSTPLIMSTYLKIRRWIDGTVAGLFSLAGFVLIRSAFKS